ncbi:hypothetical protein [Roseisolibacter agri]|uniref:ParB/Sulfiredoxin domain-containing protein n=1 Tax=Roseisolibacter agri TaxID=2014610 RepID=A0AA37QEU9_9BACT|nr:hypothetical protein [Roseisolibacter agri]GLC25050.1 hypothetical protein rosag_15630 [Roseisolibacter agri]
MAQLKSVAVAELLLDQANFRTPRQRSQLAAVEAMISTSPDRFWALVESILDDGYLQTENIIVLSQDDGSLVVREGNRRVAALKLIQGQLSAKKLNVPEHIVDAIAALSEEWLRDNDRVPCAVFPPRDAKKVDRIVRLAHGKGEKAGRDQWNAVARARHNRDEAGASEPALDLLEQYLASAKNLPMHLRSAWAAIFPLTVLEEAMKRTAPRLGLGSARALATAYPNLKNAKHRASLEAIIFDIGSKELGYEQLRSTREDYGIKYGLPALEEKTQESGGSARAGGTAGGGDSASQKGDRGDGSTGAGAKGTGQDRGKEAGSDEETDNGKPAASSTSDPRAVVSAMKAFVPKGTNREKVVTLKGEIERMNITRTPHAFLFVLRSMFEISAKAYCADHPDPNGPKAVDAQGNDRKLVEVLRDVAEHMIKLPNGKKNQAVQKRLHGALTELATPESLLSVTSMNQLVHHPTFTVTPREAASRFFNVFPLLQAMNE